MSTKLFPRELAVKSPRFRSVSLSESVNQQRMIPMKTNWLKVLATCVVLAVLPGCGEEQPPAAPAGPPLPLSVEEWKQLPIEVKYDEATFDRLRDKDAKLQNDRNWHRFMKEVVVPERKLDIPGIPGA